MPKHPLPQETVDAFHSMWDFFPEPVSLVHKSREVIAVNKVHFYSPGVFCAKMGRGGPHVGCLANQALKEQKAVAVTAHSQVEKQQMITYWIPVKGHPEYYVHFSVRIKVDHDQKSVTLSSISDYAREFYSFDPKTAQTSMSQLTERQSG
ncbi:MAG: hypothetical protein LBP33_08365 [Candidatus Adiutrix sp.]|jgi:hypothetical protein|nr:hypothetical protein [Candidatus Adiutrix sp.]